MLFETFGEAFAQSQQRALRLYKLEIVLQRYLRAFLPVQRVTAFCVWLID